tara:strand:- start:404 stop:598 length:195 start_codon:yes stop_codon:yes gene_type:complete
MKKEEKSEKVLESQKNIMEEIIKIDKLGYEFTYAENITTTRKKDDDTIDEQRTSVDKTQKNQKK